MCAMECINPFIRHLMTASMMSSLALFNVISVTILLCTLGSSPREVDDKPVVPVAAVHTGSCHPPAVTCPPTNSDTQTTERQRQQTNMNRSQHPLMTTNPAQIKDNAGKMKPSVAGVDSGQVSSGKTKAQLKAERRAVQVKKP